MVIRHWKTPMKRTVSALALSIFILQIGMVQAAPRKPTTDMTKQALAATRDQWIAFRDFNGRQLIYFTGLITWKCGLNEIRYSVNSERLEQTFPLPKCNPHTPFAVDPEYSDIYLDFAPGTAKTIAVQLVYGDDTKSPMMTYKPCNVEGDATCAVPVKRGEEN